MTRCRSSWHEKIKDVLYKKSILSTNLQSIKFWKLISVKICRKVGETLNNDNFNWQLTKVGQICRNVIFLYFSIFIFYHRIYLRTERYSFRDILHYTKVYLITYKNNDNLLSSNWTFCDYLRILLWLVPGRKLTKGRRKPVNQTFWTELCVSKQKSTAFWSTLTSGSTLSLR